MIENENKITFIIYRVESRKISLHHCSHPNKQLQWTKSWTFFSV